MIYQQCYKMWCYTFTFVVVMPLWLALINSVVNGDADVVEIDIESGRIRGKRSLTLYNEKPYYSFRGIPYAQPPIKDLRFKVSPAIWMLIKLYVNVMRHVCVCVCVPNHVT